MKIKKYFEFTTEGLKDLTNSMIVSGELKRLNKDNWSSSEISDIEERNYFRRKRSTTVYWT